jgi:hypothetical protein
MFNALMPGEHDWMKGKTPSGQPLQTPQMATPAQAPKKRNPVMNALSAVFEYGAPEAFQQGYDRRTKKELGNMLASGDVAGAGKYAYQRGQFEAGDTYTSQAKEQETARRQQEAQGIVSLFSNGPQMVNQVAMEDPAGFERMTGMTADEYLQAASRFGDGGAQFAQYALAKAQAELGQGPAAEEAYTLAPGARRFVGGELVAENPVAEKPIEVNGVLVDPVTFQPIGDYRTPAQTGELTPYQQQQLSIEARRLGISEAELMLKIQQAEEAAAAGPEINVDDEASFRREYNSITSGFRDVQASYGRIKATDATTPAGQLSLVYQYMKMLDPGSTVMQGEQASAANAAGVPEKTRNLYNSIIEGKPLSGKQVADFTRQADLLYNRSLEDYDKARITYEGIANQYGFDPRRTVPDYATGRPTGEVFRGGAVNRIPQPAVQELLSDPSPEAMREFDEVFGRGQAQKIMQQQGRAPSRITF